MPAEANRIVKGVLDKHRVEPLADDLIEKGDAIIAKYEDNNCHFQFNLVFGRVTEIEKMKSAVTYESDCHGYQEYR